MYMKRRKQDNRCKIYSISQLLNTTSIYPPEITRTLRTPQLLYLEPRFQIWAPPPHCSLGWSGGPSLDLPPWSPGTGGGTPPLPGQWLTGSATPRGRSNSCGRSLGPAGPSAGRSWPPTAPRPAAPRLPSSSGSRPTSSPRSENRRDVQLPQIVHGRKKYNTIELSCSGCSPLGYIYDDLV